MQKRVATTNVDGGCAEAKHAGEFGLFIDCCNDRRTVTHLAVNHNCYLGIESLPARIAPAQKAAGAIFDQYFQHPQCQRISK